MDAEALFSQLEFNTGEFPEDILTEAIDQHGSIIPLLRMRSIRYRFESEAGVCWELWRWVSRVSFSNHSGCEIPGK